MIRSYALTLAAVTLRIYLPASQIAGIPFPDAYQTISWLCWVPNLVVAEWWILRSRLAPGGVVELAPRSPGPPARGWGGGCWRSRAAFWRGPPKPPPPPPQTLTRT